MAEFPASALANLAALYRCELEVLSMDPDRARRAITDLQAWIADHPHNPVVAHQWMSIARARHKPLNEPTKAALAYQQAERAGLPHNTDLGAYYWRIANLFLMWPSIFTAVYIHRLRSDRMQYLYRVLFVIYLAGLQNSGDDVYEAADLDGVSWWGKFWRIELPLIMTQVRLNLILMIIGTFQAYGFQYILLGADGGPQNRGMTPGPYMFSRAFEQRDYGYACAIGLVPFVIILVLTVINQKYVRIKKQAGWNLVNSYIANSILVSTLGVAGTLVTALLSAYVFARYQFPGKTILWYGCWACYEHLSWLGLGPWENYPDRLACCWRAVHTSTVSDQYVPHIMPQEHGLKCTTDWVRLGRGGQAVRIAGARPFAFSALHFHPADLTAATHTIDLKPRPETILCVDAAHRGVGTASCGPDTFEHYRHKEGLTVAAWS